MDSGASYHLVDAKDLTRAERRAIRKLTDPIPLSTANGVVWATYQTDIYVNELGITVTAIILENTVPVLSLGKLVDEEGFDYIWKSQRIPFLEKGETKVLCYPTNNVPFIMNVTQLNGSQATPPLPTPPLDERYSPQSPAPPQPPTPPQSTPPIPSSQVGEPSSQDFGPHGEEVPMTPGSPGGPGGVDPCLVLPDEKAETDAQGDLQRKVKAEKKVKREEAKGDLWQPSALERKLVRARDKRKARRKKVSNCQMCEHNVFTHSLETRIVRYADKIGCTRHTASRRLKRPQTRCQNQKCSETQ